MHRAALIALVLYSSIAAAQDNTISIRGSVSKPGTYPVDPNGVTTLLMIIGLAGGLAEGWYDQAYIYRTDRAGTLHEILVPIRKIMQRKSSDVKLNPGDAIYIPGIDGKHPAQPVIDDRIRLPE